MSEMISYQYFGGITTWHNPVYDGPSSSPVKLSQSRMLYWYQQDLPPGMPNTPNALAAIGPKP